MCFKLDILRYFHTTGRMKQKKASFINLDRKSVEGFRKETYEAFWQKVRTLTGNEEEGNSASTARSRLPSYRSLVDRLLEPPQESATDFLLSCKLAKKDTDLVREYFLGSFSAFNLCGILLKNIEDARSLYAVIQNILENDEPETTKTFLLDQFSSFTACANPFTVYTERRFQEIDQRFGGLHEKLELRGNKLDDAAKAAYVLERDLATMSRLVTLLQNEVEHTKAMVSFCLEKSMEISTMTELVHGLRENDCDFSQRLDELEEYVYLCFVTINRARNTVYNMLMHKGSP